VCACASTSSPNANTPPLLNAAIVVEFSIASIAWHMATLPVMWCYLAVCLVTRIGLLTVLWPWTAVISVSGTFIVAALVLQDTED
jgi:hypothetical protein